MNKVIARPFWVDRIRQAWSRRPVVWLSGVRRVGKTTLTGMLGDTVYLNCDLPSTVRRLEDPESFFDGFAQPVTFVFDEIHRLPDPSRILKIGADAYPQHRFLATGSSTLAATRHFRDSLAGRKEQIYLPPVLWTECLGHFGAPDLVRRLLQGGLPQFLLAGGKDPGQYAEWIDSFYARDILDLFNVRNRAGFLTLFNMLLMQSGGLLDYTSLARESGLSRPTVMSHLEALSVAHAVYLLPPFHGGGKRELVRRHKCYAFDTGIITHARGWEQLRPDDIGGLWEHLALDMLRSSFRGERLFYWRDKSGREIDFIVRKNACQVHAIECKRNPDKYNPESLRVFRSLYPDGRNIVASPGVRQSFVRTIDTMKIEFVSSGDMLRAFDGRACIDKKV